MLNSAPKHLLSIPKKENREKNLGALNAQITKKKFPY
jgi:hypothetical protein